MRTFMNETQDIENYLLFPQSDNAVLMEARMLLDPQLREKVEWQQKTYAIVQEYGRQKLRNEMDQVHQELFTNDRYISFREKIRNIFGV